MAERTGIRSRKRDVLKWVTGATAVLSLFFAVRQFGDLAIGRPLCSRTMRTLRANGLNALS